jgi:hypothetical protein
MAKGCMGVGRWTRERTGVIKINEGCEQSLDKNVDFGVKWRWPLDSAFSTEQAWRCGRAGALRGLPCAGSCGLVSCQLLLLATSPGCLSMASRCPTHPPSALPR